MIVFKCLWVGWGLFISCSLTVLIYFAFQERVIGFHVLSPNAGELTQGYAIAMKKGATKADFDNTIGIHPTCTEVSLIIILALAAQYIEV